MLCSVSAKFFNFNALTLSEITVHSHVFEQAGEQVLLLGGSLLVNISEVSLVFFRWVHKGLDCIIASVHAELDSLVKDALWVVSSIHISEWQ